MATYSIDDGNSQQITTGIRDRASARLVAQGLADERSESVWLYRDSDGAQAFEATEIRPSKAVRS